MTKRLAFGLILLLAAALPALAQSQRELKRYFEGTDLVVRIDMPATKDGVEVRTNKAPRVNVKEHNKKLDRYGAAYRDGEVARVSQILIKKEKIILLLGQGGYNGRVPKSTGRVRIQPTPKSKEEAQLESELIELPRGFYEIRRIAEAELDHYRAEREEEDARRYEEAVKAADANRYRALETARRAGSRFIIKFKKKNRRTLLTPEGLTDVLREYVDFSPQAVQAAQRRQAEREERKSSRGNRGNGRNRN